MALLGALLATTAGWPQSGVDLNELRNRATQGDVEAQTRLGSAYASGQLGLKADLAQAIQWLRQAAEKGYAPAQATLGLLYEQGRGAPADERQAFKLYLMAAEQGYAPAQANVGSMYAEGRGVAQDFFESNLWYRQAADAGVPGAQFGLGLAYELGRGLKQDESQAARWYKTAADAGNIQAQVNYGLMLAEGRGGLTADPVQAYVMLSRAVRNGAAPRARDALAAQLSPAQMASANQLLGDAPAAAIPVVRTIDTPAAAGAASSQLVDQLREQSRRLAGQVESLSADKAAIERQAVVLAAENRDLKSDLEKARAAAPAASATPPVDVSRYQSEINALNTKLADASASLKQLQTTNAELTEAVKRAGQQKAAAPTAGADDPSSAVIVANLQRDNARLNDEVKRSTRELLSLNQQLRTLRVQVAGTTSTAPAANADELAQLTAKAQQATAEAERLGNENKQLVARVAALEAQPRPAAPGASAAELAAAKRQAEELGKQVAALQSEKTEAEKWAHSLEGNINEQSAAAKVVEAKQAELLRQLGQAQGRLKDRETELAAQKQANSQLTERNKDLDGRLAQSQKELKATAAKKPDTTDIDRARKQLEEANVQIATLQQQEKTASTQLATATEENKKAKASVAQLEKDLAAARAVTTETAALKASLAQSSSQVTDLQRDLATARQQSSSASSGADGLKQQLADAKAALDKSNQNVAELTAAKARVERDLTALQQQSAATTSGGEALRQQLADAKTALDKGNQRLAELAAAKEGLERDLKAAKATGAATAGQQEELTKARRDLAELSTLRQENVRLREAAAGADELAKKNAQLTRDNEQLTSFMNGNRADLDKAQARVAELEKQLGDATTVRTEGGQAMQKLQADLTEANRTVDKLNDTVADLTGANEKLSKDLDTAQKSAAAALAAQSQAVSAANSDSYQMEIGTLNTRIKQLEAQGEEERANAAREVATLANQLQRTRETNRSLTDANRALVEAKDSETSATRDEIAQAQSRIKELTTAGDELRRQAQASAANLRALTEERDELKSQLVDARKVMTTMPGLADEKAALQERLEAVGAELLQVQKSEDDLQKANADLTKQLAASQEAAEKSQADLTALQGKVADAEKAADAHNASVAELTAANQRLEQEKEDMRRLVDSYRGDIARLTQNVRTSEQQRADSERGGQQNIDALTAQMNQLRRDLDAARTTQARLTENYAAQERDRSATIAQLRSDNAALAARLNQAQGTLDQIAAAARLGTPAATIAAGGAVPVVRTSSAPTNPPPATADGRFHTVAEGDSLSRISMRYYGTPNRWQDIYQANRDSLQGSNALRVGQQLRIP